MAAGPQDLFVFTSTSEIGLGCGVMCSTHFVVQVEKNSYLFAGCEEVSVATDGHVDSVRDMPMDCNLGSEESYPKKSSKYGALDLASAAKMTCVCTVEVEVGLKKFSLHSTCASCDVCDCLSEESVRVSDMMFEDAEVTPVLCGYVSGDER